jgi:hypothetical protein
MAVNQTIDFLSENADRKYPFVEDCTMSAQSSNFVLPDSVILDCRGFTRKGSQSGSGLFLKAIGGAGALLIDGEVAQPDSWTVVFESTSGDRFCFYIPYMDIETNGMWHGSVSHKSDFWGAVNSSLSIVVGQGIVDIANNALYTFSTTDTPIEPSLFINFSGAMIDSVRVIKASNANIGPFYGHIKMYGGYNLQFQNLYSGNEIQGVADIGAGVYGRYLGEKKDPDAPKTSVCDSSVFAINGIPPDSSGNFMIEGGDYIVVKNIPESHTIVVSVDLSSSLTGKKDC